MILLIPLASGLDVCLSPTTPTDIPCMVVSTWEYDNCANTTAMIYNSTPTLQHIQNFTYYGATTRCNFTWNISRVDSYTWNTSNGDSGGINVEVDETMNLAITIMLTLFSMFLIGIGMWLFFKNRQEEKE